MVLSSLRGVERSSEGGSVMEVYDVVKKLVGEIAPIGETNADNARFENLKAMTELVDKLLSDIDEVANRKTSHSYSIKRAGEYASAFFDRIGIVE
jgi:hypothetical protein